MLDVERALERASREREARKAAESLLEQKSRELYLANQELTKSRDKLEERVAERVAELAAAQKRNLDVARRAGMADMATSVLHNVGNVLNSVNVSATVVSDKLRHSGLSDLHRAAAMLKEHLDDPGAFITSDVRGKHLPRFLVELSSQMSSAEEAILAEMAALSKSVGHIREIVAVQQNCAGTAGFIEEVSLGDLLDDAIRINMASMDRHQIEVRREFAGVPRFPIDKQKFLQIVVNLISNAKNAVLESNSRERVIIVRLSFVEAERARVEVSDTGVGIAIEHMARIFSHGFTTRKNGHGFGLHSALNLATEMGGTLTASSPGAGQGATFTLEIPRNGFEASP